MTLLTRYMNSTSASTVHSEATAKWRPGAGLPHAERSAAGHTRATEHDRHELRQQVDPATGLLGAGEQRHRDDEPADEEARDLDDAEDWQPLRVAEPPLDQAHRRQDDVAERHRRGVGPDLVAGEDRDVHRQCDLDEDPDDRAVGERGDGEGHRELGRTRSR